MWIWLKFVPVSSALANTWSAVMRKTRCGSLNSSAANEQNVQPAKQTFVELM